MRIVGLDVGRRRIGVAISDPTRTLARPVGVLAVTDTGAGVIAAVQEVTRLAAEDDGVQGVVVGLPRRLDGTPNGMTAVIEQFVARLRAGLPMPVAVQDERLSSREAESRLAVRDKDWRSRKAKLDAAAAAVILQDYLDA
jgi:putative Holliday junction resolvase